MSELDTKYVLQKAASLVCASAQALKGLLLAEKGIRQIRGVLEDRHVPKTDEILFEDEHGVVTCLDAWLMVEALEDLIPALRKAASLADELGFPPASVLEL